MRVERIQERIVAVLCNVIRPLRGGRTEKKALHVKKGQAASHDGSFWRALAPWCASILIMVSSGVWQVYPPDRDMHLKREGQRDEPLICLIFCGQLGMLQMDHHWGPQKCIQLHSSRSSRSQVAYDHQQQQQQQNRFKIPPAFPPCACLLLSTQCKCQKCTMVRIVPSFENQHIFKHQWNKSRKSRSWAWNKYVILEWLPRGFEEYQLSFKNSKAWWWGMRA